MMKWILLTFTVLLISGCSTNAITPETLAVMTEEEGQCIAMGNEAPSFNKKKVRFRCENGRVLLGGLNKVDDRLYIQSANITKKQGTYKIDTKKDVEYIRSLESICEIKPFVGSGDKKIRRYYFDLSIKSCRVFEWSGKGGFVPFESLDECEQRCLFKYQG